jgi:hypothetical protein
VSEMVGAAQNVDVTSASTLTRSPERQDGGVRR